VLFIKSSVLQYGDLRGKQIYALLLLIVFARITFSLHLLQIYLERFVSLLSMHHLLIFFIYFFYKESCKYEKIFLLK